MSSNNNSEANGIAMAFALIGAALIFLGIFIYFALAAFTFVLSVFCLFTLTKPRKFGKSTVTPDVARWFLIRGVIGWFAFPLVVSVVVQTMDWRISSDWTIHFMVAGYIIGALGGELILEMIDAQNEQNDAADVVAPPAPPMLPPPQPEPFTFASWEDEWKGDNAAIDDRGPWK